MKVQVQKMKTKKTKKELRTYLNEIKHCLTCPYSLKTAFIKDFSSRVNAYIEENDTETIDDIIDYFGTPGEIAENFYSVNDIGKLKKKAKIYSLIIATLSVLSVLLVILVVYSVLFIFQNGGGIIINNYER